VKQTIEMLFEALNDIGCCALAGGPEEAAQKPGQCV